MHKLLLHDIVSCDQIAGIEGVTLKVSVRLVATASGQNPRQRFVLHSGEGKTHDHQTTVWEYLKMRLSVEGLTYGTTPSGMITMRLPAAKITTDLHDRLYRAAQDALGTI